MSHHFTSYSLRCVFLCHYLVSYKIVVNGSVKTHSIIYMKVEQGSLQSNGINQQYPYILCVGVVMNQ